MTILHVTYNALSVGLHIRHEMEAVFGIDLEYVRSVSTNPQVYSWPIPDSRDANAVAAWARLQGAEVEVYG